MCESRKFVALRFCNVLSQKVSTVDLGSWWCGSAGHNIYLVSKRAATLHLDSSDNMSSAATSETLLKKCLCLGIFPGFGELTASHPVRPHRRVLADRSDDVTSNACNSH